MTSNDMGYRTGRRVGHTIYRDGVFIGSCITPEVARDLVEAANRGRLATAEGPLPGRPPISARNVKLGDRLQVSDEEALTVSAVRQLPDGDVEIGIEGRGPVRFRAGDELAVADVEP